MRASKLILASASPRRVQMMQEAGYAFEVVSSDVEEAHDPALTCDALTIENARRKALAISTQHPGATVLAADTLVYINGEPLAKPADLNEGRDMMHKLSGRTHQVCTGVAIARDGDVETFAVITDVTFRALTDDLVAEYHSKVHVLDKAGGYAVQDHGDLIIECVKGSLTNVIGLPMDEVRAALARRGFSESC